MPRGFDYAFSVAQILESLAHLPTAVLFLLFACLWVLIAFGLLWGCDRFVPYHVRKGSFNGVRNMMAIAASFYSFLVGFIVVQEWSTVGTTKTLISQQAANLATAEYAATTLPSPNAENVLNSLAAFTKSELCDEIPALEDSTVGRPRTNVALFRLYQTAATVSPESVKGLPGYSQVFSDIGDISDLRYQIINGASQRVPLVLLIVVFGVGLFLVCTVTLQDVKHRKSHVGTVIAVALFVAAGNTVIVSLNRPFVGAVTVSSQPLAGVAAYAFEVPESEVCGPTP